MKKILLSLLLLSSVAYADTHRIFGDNVNIDSAKNTTMCAGTGSVKMSVNCSGGGTQHDWTVENDGDLANDSTAGGNVVFNKAGSGVVNAVYAPVFASTPVAGTNQILPGFNVVPATTTANHIALLPATPVPGASFRIWNASASSVKIMAGGTATINSASSTDDLFVLAAKVSSDCLATSTSNYACTLNVNPTPQ